MIHKTLSLIAVAVIVMGAAPVKLPAKLPTAKSPAAAAKAPPMDSRDPASVIEVLSAAGVKGVVGHKDADGVFVTATSMAANFSVQFAGCDAQGRTCKVMLFDQGADLGSPTFAQLNGFNQASAMCRTYEDKGGKPHVVYSTLVFADDSRPRLNQQLAAWRGCIGEFQTFLKDPNAYLASAP